MTTTYLGSDYSTTATLDVRFVYDGWNLIAEINATSTALKRSYTWGNDLSGTLTKAGGIGGLLLVTHHGGVNTNCFVAYDGNGNVTATVQASTGATAAVFEYGPFGEVIRRSGGLAVATPFRFSTKFADEETGLVYYGYRYYSPSVGRWVGRDPKMEAGGLHLFTFCLNQPINGFDPDGKEFELGSFLASTGIWGALQVLLGLS